MTKRVGGGVSETMVKIYQSETVYISEVRNFNVRLLDNFKSHAISWLSINIFAQDGVT
jgi:hypothetical protein